MAFFNFLPPQPPTFDRARAFTPLPEVPTQPPAGSLVLIDTFQDRYEGAAHGNTAAFAARQQGFRGNIYAENIGPDVPAPHLSGATHDLLNSGPLDPTSTRQALQHYSRLSHRELLEAVTGDLNKVRERGLHNSAVNISYAESPQDVAHRLYREVAGGAFPGNPNHQLSSNVIQAYGLDHTRLTSPDPAVSGPERARLQQALLQAAEAGAAAPDVQRAQQGYNQAVHALEANHNSVVVSSGNNQQTLDDLARDAGGRRPQVGPGSSHNVLVNSEVTTVGATRWFQNGRERIADYSTRDREVDIYASGSVGNGFDPNRMQTSGTSFAAPRVAAAMATLHGTHPSLSSSQVENLMRNRLTHSVADGSGGVPVLDYQRTEEYMRRGTF